MLCVLSHLAPFQDQAYLKTDNPLPCRGVTRAVFTVPAIGIASVMLLINLNG